MRMTTPDPVHRQVWRTAPPDTTAGLTRRARRYATLSTSYPAPSYRVVEEDEDLPGVRAYTTPVSYVVRY
jgi:hypothetical protein